MRGCLPSGRLKNAIEVAGNCGSRVGGGGWVGEKCQDEEKSVKDGHAEHSTGNVLYYPISVKTKLLEFWIPWK